MEKGDYVRTPLGIAKYIGRTEWGSYEFDKLDEELWSGDIWGRVYSGDIEEVVLKHSPNIIDLIEIGDYVNGMEVSRIGGTYYGRKDIAIYCDHNVDENCKGVMLYDDEIKSIVTKEQFEKYKYELGKDYLD